MKNLDTTIRLRKETKSVLSNLDFVKKDHSYEEIIQELIKNYNLGRKNK
ncbi:MAG: hypothetical protein PHD81_04970 [Candidatus Nanoarchaeia archaeon]|nr:hypothetical protein [Candidatus Nanoarchaeia archaeon]